MRISTLLAVGLILSGAACANAAVQITQVTFEHDDTITPTNPSEWYYNNNHDWRWTPTGGEMVDDNSWLTDIHTYYYTTAADPMFHIVSTVTNLTGVDWEGFIVDLSGAGNYLSNPSAAQYLSVGTLSNSDQRITFTGTPVPAGATNTFQYDINLPDTGTFTWNFTLTTTAIPAVPEPASLALLGIGACTMLLRRRKTT